MNVIFPQVIAVLIPLGFLFLLRRFNFYKTGNFSYNILTILWGLIAYWFAASFNTFLIDNNYVTRDQLVFYAAPIVEEIFKALIILFLIRRADFYFIVDGIIYGFGAGIGFAVIENIEYINGNPEIALPLALSRIFSTNLIHATGSAVIGTVLAGSRFDKSLRGWGIVLLGIIFSMGAHMGFNIMVNSGVFLFIAIGVGLAGVGVIYSVVRLSLGAEKKKIDQNISNELSITNKEAKFINQVEVLQKILKPFALKFGEENSKKAQDFLLKQTHLVMARQNLAKTQDQILRDDINKNISDLLEEINGLRNKIGAYGMMYLRSMFPEDSLIFNVFDLSQQRIQSQADLNKDRTLELSTKLTDRIEETKTINQLKQAFLFNELPEELLKGLAGAVTRLKLSSGDALFRKGDAGDSLFTIGKGRVKIVAQDSSGAELTINQCGPGEVVGEMSLFDQAPRSAGVIALEQSEVLELKRNSFLALIDRTPDVALSVIKGMSQRLRFNTTFIETATEWSKKIAEGDFSFTEQSQSRDLLAGKKDEDRAAQFLAAFFAMARNVKKREDDLKMQVEKLSIQIDESRRKQEFEELTNTDFYANLKEQAKKLRAQRIDDD